MTKTEEIDHLTKVKLALAGKYRRKARVTMSKPRKLVLFRLAERFARQADQMDRLER